MKVRFLPICLFLFVLSFTPPVWAQSSDTPPEVCHSLAFVQALGVLGPAICACAGFFGPDQHDMADLFAEVCAEIDESQHSDEELVDEPLDAERALFDPWSP